MKPSKDNIFCDEELLRLYQHDVQEIWDKGISPHIYNSYHNDLEMYLNFAKNIKPMRILDAGCAQGTLALLLAENGFNVTALDLRFKFIKYAASRYESGNMDFVCSNILSPPFKSKKFDLVYAGQLIEHLINPIDLLKNIRTILKPSGYLILTTPNHEYFKNKLPSYFELNNFKHYSKYQCSADGDSHFYAFTKKELIKLFKKAGFNKVIIDYYGSPWITGHFKFRYLHHLLPFYLLKLLNKITLKYNPIKHLIGYQIIGIARTQE